MSETTHSAQDQTSSRRQRVGLFGGTFDPIHNGHLLAAQSACEAFELDRILFIPSYVTPHKRGGTGADVAARLAMLSLAIADQPCFGISLIEIERGGRGGVSFTVDTLREVKETHPEWDLWFIVGMDSLSELHLWREPEEIASLCTIATLERPGCEKPVTGVPGFDEALSARLLRHVVPGRHIDISSTDIRSRIAEGRGIRYLVPRDVEKYIREHQLYLSDATLQNFQPTGSTPSTPNS